MSTRDSGNVGILSLGLLHETSLIVAQGLNTENRGQLFQKQRKKKAMSAISIVESVENRLVARESKSGATSWKPMNRKDFAATAEGLDLKGNALKRAHRIYLQNCAVQLNSSVSSEIAAGRIIVTGVSSNAKGTGGTVKWETADHFARHEVKQVAKRLTETDALELLAKKYGVDIAALVASLKK